MERRLEAYRLRKRRQEVIKNIKTRIRKMIFHSDDKNSVAVSIDNDEKEDEVLINNDSNILKTQGNLNISDEELSDGSEEEQSSDKQNNDKWFSYLFGIISFLFWATCFAIAIELQFGIVYFLFSLLFGIYFNTRTKRKKNEISAYSVFNKDCHSIDGTLKAEQFENEIRFGYSSLIR